ncbi:MAG: hypothetical protein CMC08_07650 [Flavobacteriaceae bacterium]|nr:hypothetical protein [Flavobacteriaceae bacterium]
MTVSLRERRRQQTARDIQIATLELAAEKGLETITTEEIAAAAGVSTRTFFNYFTNKETAAIGAPPAFKEEDLQALREGTGSLAADIKIFLDKHIEVLAGDEPILKLIGSVLRSNEKARGILEGFLAMGRIELRDCLNTRVGNPYAAAALASSIMDTIGRAIYLWEHEDGLSLVAALDVIWEGTIRASQLLAAPSE